jgi:micrococcal nuclease
VRRSHRRIIQRAPLITGGIAIALLAALLRGPCRPDLPKTPPPATPIRETVATVYDGDTVATTDGRKIRLLGIDAPEAFTPFADEARDWVRRCVGGKPVILVFDVEREDSYGRTLAHVFVESAGGEQLVAEEVVRRGLALVYLKPPNLLFAERLIAAQRAAIDERIGIWSVPVKPEKSYVAGAYRFHRPSCPHAREVERPRIATDRTALLKEGKSPCRTCRP